MPCNLKADCLLWAYLYNAGRYNENENEKERVHESKTYFI